MIILISFFFFPLDSGNSFFDLDDDLMDTDLFSFGGSRSSRDPFRSQSFSAGSQRKSHRQDPPIEHDLYITLEEVLKGSTRKIRITRKVPKSDGNGFTKEDKVLTINVKPGWKAGTRVTFPREGDQRPNCIPSDIVFLIKDKPHSHFKREGIDIRYTAKITLREVSDDLLL